MLWSNLLGTYESPVTPGYIKYITVLTKSQLDWLNLPHSAILPHNTASSLAAILLARKGAERAEAAPGIFIRGEGIAHGGWRMKVHQWGPRAKIR